jgi:3-oxoacyl-[acyl-carrier-protein] synthase II
MHGHLLGATGAVEALACVMAITRGIVPPTINCRERDPEINPALNLTLDHAQEREVRATLSNTFGFGGQNSTVILRKYHK